MAEKGQTASSRSTESNSAEGLGAVPSWEGDTAGNGSTTLSPGTSHSHPSQRHNLAFLRDLLTLDLSHGGAL